MMDFWGIPWPKAALIVGNLVVLETLVSVDNAAVLASMAMRLPANQRAKALRYGLIGAYVFRGICLLLAGWMLHVWWIKPLGGAYLVFLAVKHFGNRAKGHQESSPPEAAVVGTGLRFFWTTVLAIEMMDLAFSVDNVLVAVAYADPGAQAGPEQKQAAMFLLYAGVFVGILAMRFVAQYFVGLMERFPRLEHSAYVVIGILGVKLCVGDWVGSLLDRTVGAGSWIQSEAAAHWFDTAFSVFTLLVFLVPLWGKGRAKGTS